MRILITGGAGYIGYSLVEILINNKDVTELIIFDNLVRRNINIFFNPNFRSTKIKFVEGDILDNRRLSEACENIDVVIHLAAKVTTPNASGEFHMFDYVNNWGTSNIVAQANLHKVKRFIYLSSLSIYGRQTNIEEEPTPSSDYARSKLNGERQLQILNETCKKYIIRSGNTFGYNPSIRLDTVINKFAIRTKYNQKLLINGDGNQVRSFIHIGRLTRQIDYLIWHDIEDEIVNLADYALSINTIVNELEKLNRNVEFAYVDADHTAESIDVVDGILACKAELEFRQQLEMFYSKFSF